MKQSYQAPAVKLRVKVNPIVNGNPPVINPQFTGEPEYIETYFLRAGKIRLATRNMDLSIEYQGGAA